MLIIFCHQMYFDVFGKVLSDTFFHMSLKTCLFDCKTLAGCMVRMSRSWLLRFQMMKTGHIRSSIAIVFHKFMLDSKFTKTKHAGHQVR